MPDDHDRPTEPIPVEELFDQAKPLLPSVVRAAFYRYHSSATADDIERCCDRLLFKLWRDDYHVLRSFRQEASLRTYLLKIAYYEVVDFLRERKKSVPLEDLPPEMIEQSPPQEQHLLHEEYVQLLKKAVKQLSVADQELYDLEYREELPVEEIAQRLGSRTEAIWQRISRLRKRLKALTGGG
jgi:RNA polymerase sigma-70 factor, ECF subfamily